MENKTTKVAVHSGKFHADDVFAVAILSLYLKKPIKIIRTRDPKVWADADYVFDVGREYDPKRNRFDHHQESFNLKRENGAPYSSAGLAWKYFGEKIAGSKEVWQKIDKEIIQPLDIEDNGVELYKSNFEGIAPYSFFDYLDAYNSTWKEKREDSLKEFKLAVAEAKKMLEREIKRLQDESLGEKYVEDVYKKTSDKRIIVLDNNYSWEKVLVRYPEPLFVILPDLDNDSWHAHAVGLKEFNFKNRLDFPKNWAGKENDDLAKITGVKDAIFCHKGRFIAVAKSKEGAIALAKLALNQNKH